MKTVELTRTTVVTIKMCDDDSLPDNVTQLMDQRLSEQNLKLREYLLSLVKNKEQLAGDYERAMKIIG